MSNYEKQKQIYCLSFASNSAFGLSFSPSGTPCTPEYQSGLEKLQNFVFKVANQVITDSTTTAFIGSDWSLVWGPVVFSNAPNTQSVHADNTLGVFFSPSQNLYVVAIAGTNENSMYGWAVEDFQVGNMVTWESITGAKDSGNIALGTSKGLEALLTMKDQNGKGIGFLEALLAHTKSHANAATELAVSGHSLGGTLTPVVARYLFEKRNLWDTNQNIKLSAFPTAGATPGDQNFVSYYEKNVEDTQTNDPQKIYYHGVYNSLDVVPHAWQPSMMAQIPTLYPTLATDNNKIIGALALAAEINGMAIKKSVLGKKVPFENPYQQIQPLQKVDGKFNSIKNDELYLALTYLQNTSKISDELKPFFGYLRNVVLFVVQMLYQHTTAYPKDILDIEGFIQAYNAIVTTDKDAIDNNLKGRLIKQITGLDSELIDLEAIAKVATEENKAIA